MSVWRAIAFYVGLGLLLATGLFGLFAAAFDKNESAYVAHLAASMPASPLSDGAYPGPDNTVLVSGWLDASPLTPTDLPTQRFTQCIVLQQTLEYYEHRSKGSDWHTLRTTNLLATAPRIDLWQVDPSFFASTILPLEKETLYSSKTPMDCAGHNRCRLINRCLPPGPTSIIGTRQSAEGMPMVALPDPSLVNYPLVQRGKLAPNQFARAYARHMADRYNGVTNFMIWAVLATIVFALARGERPRPEEPPLTGWRKLLRARKQRDNIFSPVGPGWRYLLTAVLYFSLPLALAKTYENMADEIAFWSAFTMAALGLILLTYLLLLLADASKHQGEPAARPSAPQPRYQPKYQPQRQSAPTSAPTSAPAPTPHHTSAQPAQTATPAQPAGGLFQRKGDRGGFGRN